jgi:hypothetical protein
MKMNRMALVAPFLAALSIDAAQAQAVTIAEPRSLDGPYKPVRFLFGIGVSGGGDKLISGQYEDGRTADIRAGGLFYLTAGIDFHLAPDFSLQGTINYHADDASAWNGDLRFERFPIELISYWQPNPVFRVGGGLRYVVSPKLTSNGNAPEANTSYANTRSPIVEAEYFVDPNTGIKLRYVHETYKARGREIDGSHVGISANFYF